MLDTLKAIQPNMTHFARLERPPRKHTHVTHPSRIVKAVAAKFFFSYFKRFSSTTSFEEKVRIVNNLSDSLTDDKRKYSRNFLARIGLSSSIRFSMYPKNMSSLLVLHH